MQATKFYRGVRVFKQIEDTGNITEEDLKRSPTISCKTIFPWSKVISIEEYPHDDFKSYGEITTVFLLEGEARCVVEKFESVATKYEEYLNSLDKNYNFTIN